ncbi:MAG: hypothetical protein H6779_03035 [Candidatus Nomurabacteria bacterium]|nr:MAG: hypothetical protein H6779_03035 [Candidatus Nomurabacteria bacterium]
MNIVTVDTHKTIRKLMEKGYTEKQAEGFVEALTESDLVTKDYLDSKLTELRLDIRAEMYKALLIHGLIVVATMIAVAKAF